MTGIERINQFMKCSLNKKGPLKGMSDPNVVPRAEKSRACVFLITAADTT